MRKPIRTVWVHCYGGNGAGPFVKVAVFRVKPDGAASVRNYEARLSTPAGKQLLTRGRLLQDRAFGKDGE